MCNICEMTQEEYKFMLKKLEDKVNKRPMIILL